MQKQPTERMLRTARRKISVSQESNKWMLEHLTYNPDTGTIFTKHGNQIKQESETGMCIVWNPVAKKNIRVKYDKLCYYLAHQKIITDEHRILHRNLDELDCTLRNLKLVHKSVYYKIQEALRNLNGGIRMQPHLLDQFATVICWYEKNREKHKVVYDQVAAQRVLLLKKLEYSKILTKYCIFD